MTKLTKAERMSKKTAPVKNNTIDRLENKNLKYEISRDPGKGKEDLINDPAIGSMSDLLVLIQRQQEVILHNREDLGVYDIEGRLLSDYFKHKTLMGDTIIVHLCKTNAIVNNVTFTEDGRIGTVTPLLDKLETDGRYRDLEKLQNNPIPVVGVGRIVAISPEALVSYVESKNNMDKLGIDTSNYHIPRVGDYVTITGVSINDDRYYLDKQAAKEDYLGIMTEWRVSRFSNLFKCSRYQIESIIPLENVNEITVPEIYFNNTDRIMEINDITANYILASDLDILNGAQKYYAEYEPETEVNKESIERYKEMYKIAVNKRYLEELNENR